MVHIQAPGTFTVNGGVKVRIYYTSSEFANLPANRTWFKHPSHTKTGVLADLTATGLTNATTLTPDSTGTENGQTFVQFNNITSFSSFGYMGTASCPTPSVGGSTATATPTVCGATNGGTITLSGETGSVVKWQTSINGGTSWTDIANTTTSYMFTNAVDGQEYRAVVNNSGSCVDANSSATMITVAGTTAPSVTPTTASNTCTTTTVDLTALPQTVTVPTGTTLVWSTNAVPTSVADTLTTAEANTVGVSGRYYALFYDAVNACYSPSDFVDVTITANPMPTIVAVTKTNPTTVNCPLTNTGVIVVVATGSNLEYSNDNGTTWQVSSVFTHLNGGS